MILVHTKMNLHPLYFIQTAYFMLLLIVTFKAANPVVGYNRGNETDYKALLAIKSQLIDHPTNGVLSSWNHSLHHCSWDGVTCGHKHKRVVKLFLYGRLLGGTISPFVGNMSFLRELVLANNSLSGQIPHEIGRLYRLQGLNLYNNSLSGEIPPNISACVHLRNLSLPLNNLQGELPMGLGALTNLERLWLESNKFSGPLFKVVANLTSLEIIEGEFNAFTGNIPDSISRMQNLSYLSLNYNKLSGMVPPSIFNLSFLQNLELGANQLQGRIPPNIGSTLPQLQWLSFFDNHLSGPLPTSIQNLTSLKVIQLITNNFTGSVSIDFGKLYNLQWLSLSENNLVGDIDYIITSLVNCSTLKVLQLSNNEFTGVLPKVVANLSRDLDTLWVGENQLRGIIPKGVSDLINLRTINVSKSNLTGTLPLELGKLQKLETLSLDSNKLTGEIPSSIKNLSHLSKLSLFNNHLQGTIPSSLGSCESLLYVYLSNNNFKGPLPRELFGGSAKFVELDLSENRLEGSIPNEISEQIKLITFGVSRNKLSGEIPPFLGSLYELQGLYMEGNFFHGSIPSSFASLKSLQILDLSQNKIYGPIPEYFSAFPLFYLNLSFNDLEGKVPTNGVYANASAISLAGNSKLCGGILELHLPRCVEKRKKKKMSHALESTIVTISAFAGVLTMMTFIWLCLKRKKTIVFSHAIVKQEPFMKVSYDMLLKATDGFSSENLLGSGTFGTVYKGILDGNSIAVKVLNLQQRSGYKSFMAECQMLKNIRHRNLLRIITACSSTDFQRNDFKALVYEFMPNGSLYKWLHEEGNLNLLQRLDIAIDVAHALNYLHHECENPIMHRDLNPSNILLDEDMVAHVADFGLAKVLGQPLHPNQSSSIGAMGTVGYVAPECGMGTEASLEADLYAYGILLLELMTRKRPTDNEFQGDFSLHMYAKAALPDQVMQIVDSELTVDDQEDEEEDNRGPRTSERLQQREECIMMIVKVGIACSDQLPHNRMKISAAISELQAARNILHNFRHRQNMRRGKQSLYMSKTLHHISIFQLLMNMVIYYL